MTQEQSQKINLGIIGFGQVGQAMAGVLVETHDVTVFDLNTEKCRRHDLVSSGRAKLAPSIEDLVKEADLVILSLPNPQASRVVANSIAAVASSGMVVLETSTVAPEDIEALDAVLQPRGVRVVDAAVIGGIHKLSHGQAVFLVGASRDGAGPVRPVLELLAEEVFYLERQGGGMRAKLVANAVSHAVYVVLAETAAVAAAQDIPMDVFYRLLARESGLSRPLTHRIGERLFQDNFAGGMSTVNARKDSRLFLETAQRLEIPLFATQAAHSVYEIAAREGMGSEDYAIIAKLWENWAGVRFSEGQA